MRLKVGIIFAVLSFFYYSELQAQTPEYGVANYRESLLTAWHKEGMPRVLHLSYTETWQQLYHSAEPWQTYTRTTSGEAWFDAGNFAQTDTIHSKNGKLYIARTVFDSTKLLQTDFGDTALTPATKGDWYHALIESARYSPVILLNYFFCHNDEAAHRTDSGFLLYTLTIDKIIVTLAIRASDTLVEWVHTIESDDLRGDVETLYHYCRNRQPDYVSDISVPDSVEIEKFGGRVRSLVKTTSSDVVSFMPAVFEKSIPSEFAQEKMDTPKISVKKYSDHIHFIDLEHTQARSMIVEFSNFLLVVDAPLASKNGEIIIGEAKKIAPNKPIRYFAFGHHHPWYIGGMRPFIYRDVTVITTAGDSAYLSYLATAPHSLDPDSLSLHPHPLRTEEIRDSMTISDGNYEMKIYYIGKKSQHTNDYTLFYFPSEKMLWEDDLAWIKKDKPIEKAGERQAGLVNAIKDLGLHPEMVVQSWPLSNYGVKTLIPFADLESSLNVK